MSCLVLPAELDIRHARDLHGEWMHWLAALQGPCQLDPTGVTRVDGTGLCLLLALTRTLTARAHAWEWHGGNAVLDGAATAMGVARQLQWRSTEERAKDD